MPSKEGGRPAQLAAPYHLAHRQRLLAVVDCRNDPLVQHGAVVLEALIGRTFEHDRMDFPIFWVEYRAICGAYRPTLSRHENRPVTGEACPGTDDIDIRPVNGVSTARPVRRSILDQLQRLTFVLQLQAVG